MVFSFSSLSTHLQTLQKKFPLWDLVMVFDCLLFFLSFWILATEKDVDLVYPARAWLWYMNALFILDLFFRLLSIRIESIKREYWNPILPCIFTLILWMLAAYYDFEEVFGSKPVQGFNIFIFLIYNLGVIGYILLSCLIGSPDREASSPSQQV